MCKISENTKKAFRYTIMVLAIGLIVKASYELKYLDVATGIIRLETSKKGQIQRISMKTLSFVGYADCEDAFISTMNDMGWHFIKHYGRGMIFEKEGYEILITKRNYFNKYLVFEVTTREIFDLI
ncbi:hypothetical protein [Fusibacter bizertensis]